MNVQSFTKETLSRLLYLAAWYREHPADAFVPSPALADFMDSDHDRILVRAANRVGKSKHAACKLAKKMLSSANKKYRAVSVTVSHTIKVISKYLYEFLPKDQLVDSVYSESRGWRHNLIKLKNGTTCQIMTYKQGVLNHSGDDLDGVWMDEPPPMDVFAEALARVFSKDGFVWMTFTPVGAPVEWLHELVSNIKSTWIEYNAILSLENCPWYSPRQIDKWYKEASCNMNSYRQRIFGDWVGQPVNVRFNHYDEARHTIFSSEELTYKSFLVGIDHGEKATRQVAILIGITEDDKFICLDEYLSDKSTTPKMDAFGITSMLYRNGLKANQIKTWTGDINTAGKASPAYTVNQLLEKEIFDLTKCRIKISKPYNKAIEKGEILLNQALSEDILLFSPDCVKLRTCVLTYNGEDHLKHSIDALRYALYPLLEKLFSKDKLVVSRIKQR